MKNYCAFLTQTRYYYIFEFVCMYYVIRIIDTQPIPINEYLNLWLTDSHSTQKKQTNQVNYKQFEHPFLLLLCSLTMTRVVLMHFCILPLVFCRPFHKKNIIIFISGFGWIVCISYLLLHSWLVNKIKTSQNMTHIRLSRYCKDSIFLYVICKPSGPASMTLNK